MANAGKPYKAKNKLIKKLETAEKETGFLDVSVYSENTNAPVSGADVFVYYFNVRGIYHEAATIDEIAHYVTDKNGKIPVIELPVIHVYGKPEENMDEYQMRVDANGYYNVIIMNMEIFPGITTNYNVVLTPFRTGEEHIEVIIIPEKH
ncbi:MAG TPA: hypothetical protein DC038_05085 [Clostridiales bacterium]|nr:hypothetical protein [Clostridiales bacterium]